MQVSFFLERFVVKVKVSFFLEFLIVCIASEFLLGMFDKYLVVLH